MKQVGRGVWVRVVVLRERGGHGVQGIDKGLILYTRCLFSARNYRAKHSQPENDQFARSLNPEGFFRFP